MHNLMGVSFFFSFGVEIQYELAQNLSTKFPVSSICVGHHSAFQKLYFYTLEAKGLYYMGKNAGPKLARCRQILGSPIMRMIYIRKSPLLRNYRKLSF